MALFSIFIYKKTAKGPYGPAAFLRLAFGLDKSFGLKDRLIAHFCQKNKASKKGFPLSMHNLYTIQA